MLTAEHLSELIAICPGAREMTEGGITYVYLPALRISSAGQTVVMDALLCPQQRDGYATRLFLSQVVQGRGNNWTTHQILSRPWYTWSWNNVSSAQRPAQILAGHLAALK
jgi:hypothetical protein